MQTSFVKRDHTGQVAEVVLHQIDDGQYWYQQCGIVEENVEELL